MVTQQLAGGIVSGIEHRALRFTEEQIIGVPKEADAGAKTKELCRRHGIS